MNRQRKKLLTIWITALAFLGLVEISMRLLFGGIDIGTLNWTEKLAYLQAGKAKAVPDGSLVLVGDSSLGNMINAQLLGELIDRPTRSLALSGQFTTMGDYVILKEVLDRASPGAVVMVHTPMFWTMNETRVLPKASIEKYLTENTERKAARAFGLISAQVRYSGVIKKLILEQSISLYPDQFRNKIKDLAQKEKNLLKLFQTFDYIPQSKPPKWDEDKVHGNTWPFVPTEMNVQYFRETARLCREKGVPLYFLAGPAWSDWIYASEEYIRGHNEFILKMGKELGIIVISPKPIPIPTRALGDTRFHIRPEYKDSYTRNAAKRLVKLRFRGSGPDVSLTSSNPNPSGTE